MFEQLSPPLSHSDWLNDRHLVDGKSIRFFLREVELGARAHRSVWLLS